MIERRSECVEKEETSRHRRKVEGYGKSLIVTKRDYAYGVKTDSLINVRDSPVPIARTR